MVTMWRLLPSYCIVKIVLLLDAPDSEYINRFCTVKTRISPKVSGFGRDIIPTRLFRGGKTWSHMELGYIGYRVEVDSPKLRCNFWLCTICRE